jgi:hypothetical protein
MLDIDKGGHTTFAATNAIAKSLLDIDKGGHTTFAAANAIAKSLQSLGLDDCDTEFSYIWTSWQDKSGEG